MDANSEDEGFGGDGDLDLPDDRVAHLFFGPDDKWSYTAFWAPASDDEDDENDSADVKRSRGRPPGMELEKLVGKEEFARWIAEGGTHKQIARDLKKEFPNEKGISKKSVFRLLDEKP